MSADFDDHHRLLRGSGKTTLNLPAVRSDPKPDAVLLQAVRDIAEGEYDVLGEMGRGKKGSVVYLARDLQSARLVALKLEHEGHDEYGLQVVQALDKSLPAVEGACPRCGGPLAGWGRFCPQCGADVSGAVRDKSADELLEAVRDAAGEDLEVLGEMDRAEGGGRVYFARDRSDGRIVALRLQRDPDARGADEYVIDRTQVLKPIAAGVDATVVRPAIKRPVAPTRPPPVLTPAAKPHARSGLMRTADFAKTVAADRRVLIAAAAVAVVGVVAIIVALGGEGDQPADGPVSPEPVVQTPQPAVPTPPPVDSPQVEIRADDLPPHARITVDGRDFAPGARFKLSPGRHIFRIAASGYNEVIDTVELGVGQSLIYSTPTLQRARIAQQPPPVQRRTPSQTRPEPEPDPAPPVPVVSCEQAYQNEDYAQARVICERAVALGDPAAIRTFGIMHELGRGVSSNLNRAAELYRRAANAGDSRAQLNLGIMYQDGRGVERDDARAAGLFRQAAEQGSPDAQAQLGYAYQLGRGVGQDLRSAYTWYARGAEQGHSWSQFLLGYLLLDGGGGVQRNEPEAFRLLLRSAEQNLVAAQLEVAKLYRDGRGVAQSTASAIEWFERAGTPEAVAEARRLRNR